MPAKSRSQQRLMAMVHQNQKGKLKHPSAKVREMSKHISKTDSGHFAKTKHKGLPKKVRHKRSEYIPPLLELVARRLEKRAGLNLDMVRKYVQNHPGQVLATDAAALGAGTVGGSLLASRGQPKKKPFQAAVGAVGGAALGVLPTLASSMLASKSPAVSPSGPMGITSKGASASVRFNIKQAVARRLTKLAEGESGGEPAGVESMTQDTQTQVAEAPSSAAELLRRMYARRGESPGGTLTQGE